MGERWLGMREPVSLEEYAEEAGRRMRELPDLPVDLSDLAAAPQLPGSMHTVVRGDSISSIMGSSDPAAIGAFMQANDMKGTAIRAGESYIVPEPGSFAAPAAKALGQQGLNADNALATQRKQRQFDPANGLLATKTAMSSPVASEAVTVQATRPGKGEYQVRAYFTNPKNLGGFGEPLPAAHTGLKVYRGDEFLYALDAGPSGLSLRNPGPGQLIFNGTDKDLMSYQPGIEGVEEFNLTPPKGVSGEVLAKQLLQSAREYDGSLPYSPPPIGFRDTERYIADPASYAQDTLPIPYAANRMNPGEYNSNSFAAALLNRAGAASNIPDLQKHLAASKLAAPGLEQPVPQRYFRNR